jgi:hypothetical protein
MPKEPRKIPKLNDKATGKQEQQPPSVRSSKALVVPGARQKPYKSSQKQAQREVPSCEVCDDAPPPKLKESSRQAQNQRQPQPQPRASTFKVTTTVPYEPKDPSEQQQPELQRDSPSTKEPESNKTLQLQPVSPPKVFSAQPGDDMSAHFGEGKGSKPKSKHKPKPMAERHILPLPMRMMAPLHSTPPEISVRTGARYTQIKSDKSDSNDSNDKDNETDDRGGCGEAAADSASVQGHKASDFTVTQSPNETSAASAATVQDEMPGDEVPDDQVLSNESDNSTPKARQARAESERDAARKELATAQARIMGFELGIEMSGVVVQAAESTARELGRVKEQNIGLCAQVEALENRIVTRHGDRVPQETARGTRAKQPDAVGKGSRRPRSIPMLRTHSIPRIE